MNTISVERRQNDLIRSIFGIKDIDTLKSLQASVSRAKKKAAAKCEDDTCMTKEEFFAMIDQRMEANEKGNYITFSSPEEMHRYFENL